MKKQPLNAETEAYLAFGGPLLGTIGALAALGLGVGLDSPALLSIAQVGFFLNLINLVPIHPLDGGRIVTAISRWLWVVGLIGGLIIILYLKAIIFLFFWGLFAWELYKKYVRKDKAIEGDRETTLAISTPESNFFDSGLPIPAEAHRRDLPFIQSCDVQTKSEVIHIFYPGIGHIATLPFELGIVKRATLIGTKNEHGKVNMKLLLTIEVYSENQSAMFQKEEYYQVPPRVRWIYGFSYIGLAVFLGWMMLVTLSLFPPPPLVG